MIHKNRCNRRYVRLKQMKRKYKILHHSDLHNEDFVKGKTTGKLDKGKIHCSCNLCGWKSTKLRNCRDKGFTSYNSYSWYSASDRRKFDSMSCDYYENFVMEEQK